MTIFLREKLINNFKNLSLYMTDYFFSWQLETYNFWINMSGYDN